MKKNILTGLFFLVGITAVYAKPIRHWLFDEGSGDEVKNVAGGFPGKRAVTGGPLGSLEITYATPYGMDSSDAYYAKPGIQSEWTSGRYKGKSALRVGTRNVALFRSGVSGQEFTNGCTIAGWMKFEATNETAIARILRLGDGYSTGFYLCWELRPYYKKGCISFTLGADKKKGHKTQIISTPNVVPDVWHAVAVTIGKDTMKLYVNGELRAEQKIPAGVVPYKYTDSWTGMRPFVGMTRQSFFQIGLIRTPNETTMPFTMDELALFDRELTAEELKAFLYKKPAEGTLEEQIAESKKTAAERELKNKIKMEIPFDSNGYFRINEDIVASLRSPIDGSVEILLETVFGKEISKKRIELKANVEKKAFFRPNKCDAYQIWMTFRDTSGKVLKTLPRPYPIGVVPKAPDHLNSPFGWWAMCDKFSYDSNLRRTDIPMWQGVVQTNGYLRKHNSHLYEQKIPKEDLREYGFLPYGIALKFAPGHKLSAAEKEEVRAMYKPVIELSHKYGMKEFEITSEVDGRTTPDIYIQMLDLAKEEISKKIPDAKIYPPGATPCALPFINKILEYGAAKYVDGVSHHNYLANPIHSYYWSNPGKNLKAIVDVHAKAAGREIGMYNTESGIFSLPRVYNRPMTREHARTVMYPISTVGGYETYTTSMPILPETEAAAIQIHAIFVNLVSGYKMYVKCQTPTTAAIPCQQGVALTTLSGQILNDMTNIRPVELTSLKTLAVLVDRKHKHTGVKSNVFSIFGMEKATYSFLVEPNKKYRTMDMFGNDGSISSDSNGILTIASTMEPVYIFDVPSSIVQLSPMKLELPEVLPENGVLKGRLVIENPFASSIKGKLSVKPLRGAEITLNEYDVNVEGKGKKEIDVTLKAYSLKRRNYPVSISLICDGKLFTVAEKAFTSHGLIYTIKRMDKPMKLDLDESKWKEVQTLVCDTDDDVVHGKPNFAELWLPQWRGKEDLTLKVRTAYVKDDAIYFRLDITDQIVMPAPESERHLAFRYDCLELFVDSRTGKSLGSPVDDGADQVIVSPIDSPTPGKAPLWYARKNRNHVNVEAVSAKTPTGWVMEGKIVPNDRSQIKLRPGTRVMLDFLIDDCDGLNKLRKAAMAVHGALNNNSNVGGWGRYELGL